MKDGVTTYAYSNHRMTSLTDANGHVAVENIYDTANRVVEQTDAVGGVTCFYYGSGTTYTSGNCPGVSPAPDARQTVVVDARGNATTYDFDTSFRATDITDALDHTIHYGYDSDSNLTCVTDQEEHKTGFSYDPTGNVTEIIDALNTDANCELKAGGKSWSFTYTALNDIDLETDPRGNMTDYEYTDGNLTSITRKDEFGTPLATTTLTRDPGGNGDLTEITDANLHTTTFTYDGNGLLDTVDGPLAGPPYDLTDYGFDAGGRLTSVTDAEANVTSFEYDAQNNVIRVIDPENGEDAPTVYAYDAKGNRVSVTNAGRHAVDVPETGAQCDDDVGTGNGNDEDEDGAIDDGCPSSLFAYSDGDRLLSVTDALGRITAYDYDEAGNLEMRTDARGRVTTYVYDEANRLTDIEHWETWEPPVLKDTVVYTYYDDGLRQTMADATGTTSYTYFDNDQLESVTDPSGNVVQYGYDEAGNRDTITYPDPSKTVDYTYDEFDRMETVTDWLNNETRYDYDDAGNLEYTTHTYPFPSTTSFVTTYGYDEADRLESLVNDGPSGTISSFAYGLDAVGNRTQLVDNTGETDYGYDDLYRLRTVVNLQSQLDTYSYDEVGNRLTRWANPYEYDDADQMKNAYSPVDTDGDGCADEEELAGAPVPKPGATGPYDPLDYWDFYDVPVPANADPTPNGSRNRAVDIGDVLAVLFYSGAGDNGPPNGNGVDYDSDKNGDTVEDGLDYDRSPGAAPNPPWDAGPPDGGVTIGDVLAVLAQGGLGCAGPSSEAYGYDANGNQTDRGSDTFEYDHENRLIEAVVDEVTSTYAYNGDGLRVSRTVDGATTDYVWDVGSALPVILQDTAGGQTAYYVYGLDLISQIDGAGNEEYFLYDGLGSTRQLADDTGDVVATYEYDAFGALRYYDGSADTAFRFTGEQWDSESGFYYLRARYYDPAIGRFLSRDPFAGMVAIPQSLNRYQYVVNNPALYVDPYGYFGLGDAWDKTKDVAGAVGCGIKTGAQAAAGVADRARDEALSLGAWLAGCDWKKIAGGAAMVAVGAVAVGLGGYVIIAAAGTAPAVAGVATLEAWHGMVAGGAIAGGGTGLALASFVPFSEAQCGESGRGTTLRSAVGPRAAPKE